MDPRIGTDPSKNNNNINNNNNNINTGNTIKDTKISNFNNLTTEQLKEQKLENQRVGESIQQEFSINEDVNTKVDNVINTIHTTKKYDNPLDLAKKAHPNIQKREAVFVKTGSVLSNNTKGICFYVGEIHVNRKDVESQKNRIKVNFKNAFRKILNSHGKTNDSIEIAIPLIDRTPLNEEEYAKVVATVAQDILTEYQKDIPNARITFIGAEGYDEDVKTEIKNRITPAYSSKWRKLYGGKAPDRDGRIKVVTGDITKYGANVVICPIGQNYNHNENAAGFTGNKICDSFSTEKKHAFSGYEISKMKNIKDAESYNVFHNLADKKMNHKRSSNPTPNIGIVQDIYTWKEDPDINAIIPNTIKNPKVQLNNIDFEEYNKYRQITQEAVVANQGISDDQVNQIALNLSGVVIEATLSYNAGAILNDDGEDTELHYIFQSGINFAGIWGGGIPVKNANSISDKDIKDYSENNAKAALKSATNNKSDVLVFNIGIGSGFFGGMKKHTVKQANVDGIINAVQNEDSSVQVVVPNAGLSDDQISQLEEAGIKVFKGDKDAAAALLSREGLKVSSSIAADPMSILGIHGPGLWWESAKSASDEERAAFLSPCYMLGHIPIDITDSDGNSEKVAALSQFMVAEEEDLSINLQNNNNNIEEVDSKGLSSSEVKEKLKTFKELYDKEVFLSQIKNETLQNNEKSLNALMEFYKNKDAIIEILKKKNEDFEWFEGNVDFFKNKESIIETNSAIEDRNFYLLITDLHNLVYNEL